MFPILLTVLLVGLLAMALWGNLIGGRADNDVAEKLTPGANAQRVFVLVPGFDPKPDRWEGIALALQPSGDVLQLSYDARPRSNADPQALANAIGGAVERHAAGKEVVFVAHSMGALLARRAVLDGLKSGKPWAAGVKRMVLLAGMNRGWTVEGERAPDSSAWFEFQLRAGSWIGGMLGVGQLIMQVQRGAPFVANLRLEWMRHMRPRPPARPPSLHVVQMLGDIDDVVRREDNEDLHTTAIGDFALLRVRGTGHGDITDIGGAEGAYKLQRYRREKLLLAATRPFEEVRKHNEELPRPVNEKVTKIIFVLHGIRDLGRWSSAFETEVKQRYPAHAETLRFESPRYGYLGMGPFLFASVRDRYVRWFMDEYTEAVARYPNVQPEDIGFFGHSNGTYVLAAALEKYQSMTVGSVVLAGSVVRTEYGWGALHDDGRIKGVRNYVGTHDWVVAWFPRLFELPGVHLLRNPLGGGGFHGFKDCAVVENVLVKGAHGAFAGHERDIVDFLMGGSAAATPPCVDRNKLNEGRSPFQKMIGPTPVVLFVWVLLVLAVLYVGMRVVGSAPSPTWPVLLAYVLLVITILRTV